MAPQHPRIAAFTYSDVLEEGYITGITYGLSEYDNPTWKDSRLELIISVQSTNEEWRITAGFAAARFQIDSNFAYGDILDFEQPISDDSQMQAFVLFAPSILDKSDYQSIVLDYYTVNLVDMYPIYKEEIATIKSIGLERFMHHSNYNMFSVTRKCIRRA